MKKKDLTPGRRSIRTTGYILFFVVVAWITFLVIVGPKLQVALSTSSLVVVMLISFFLRKGSYLAARRIAFLAGTWIAMNCLFFLISVGGALYQLSLDQLKILMTFDKAYLANNLDLIGVALLMLWIYRRLTSVTVKIEMEEAHVPYRPFLRYGTLRGVLLVSMSFVGLVAISIFQASFLKEKLAQIDTDVKKQYGSSAFFLAQSLEFHKDPKFTRLKFDGEVYDGKKFIGRTVKFEQKNKNEESL